MSFHPDEPTLNTPFLGIVDRFEESWQKGAVPSIGEALSNCTANDSQARQELLCDLIAIDVEYRWRNSTQIELFETVSSLNDDTDLAALPQSPKLEDYIAICDDLGSKDDLPINLVVDEHRFRRMFDNRPTHDEFLERCGRVRQKLSHIYPRLIVFSNRKVLKRSSPNRDRRATLTANYRSNGSETTRSFARSREAVWALCSRRDRRSLTVLSR